MSPFIIHDYIIHHFLCIISVLTIRHSVTHLSVLTPVFPVSLDENTTKQSSNSVLPQVHMYLQNHKHEL